MQALGDAFITLAPVLARIMDLATQIATVAIVGIAEALQDPIVRRLRSTAVVTVRASSSAVSWPFGRRSSAPLRMIARASPKTSSGITQSG